MRGVVFMVRCLVFVLMLAVPAWAQQACPSTTSTTTLPELSYYAQDDFERGALGANWTNLFGTTCLINASSELSASGGLVANCYWSAMNAPSTPQYVCAQMVGQGLGRSGVCLGQDIAGSGVCCTAWDDLTGGQYWSMDAFPVFTNYDFDTTTSFPSGSYIGIQRFTATTFRCYFSANGMEWLALGAGAKVIASITNPGAPGAQANNDGGGNTPFRLEVWEAGLGGLPTSRVCGVTSTTTTSTSTSTTTST